MAYAVVDDVAKYLGRTLTVDQTTQAQLAIDAASEYIDDYTGKSWTPASPVTERHTITGPFIYLNHKPVTGVTSVNVRLQDVGAQSEALVSNVSYELFDSAKGLVFVGNYGDFLKVPLDYTGDPYVATIVYTHSLTVPKSIKLACIVLASHYMSPIISTSMQKFESMADPAGMRFTFRKTSVPGVVTELLRGKQRAAVV